MMYQTNLTSSTRDLVTQSSYVFPSCEPYFQNLQHSCGNLHAVQIGCGLKACPVCSEKKSIRFIAKYKIYLNKLWSSQTFHKRVRFITFTMQNTNNFEFKKIQWYFHELRRRKYYKKMFESGMYVIETKRGVGGWHTHIHVIVLSPFMLQKHLSRVWNNITKKSFIIDIRKAKYKTGIKKYLLGYLAKKTEFQTEQDAWDYMFWTQRQHMVQIFGTRHGKQLKFCLECSDCHETGGWSWHVDYSFSKTKFPETVT